MVYFICRVKSDSKGEDKKMKTEKLCTACKLHGRDGIMFRMRSIWKCDTCSKFDFIKVVDPIEAQDAKVFANLLEVK